MKFFGQKWPKITKNYVILTFDPISWVKPYQIGSILYRSLNKVSATLWYQFYAVYLIKSKDMSNFTPLPLIILDLK